MFSNNDLADDLMVFAEETTISTGDNTPWKILVVDDEPDLHSVTRLALSEIEFDGRPVKLVSAHSAAEARQILVEDDDFALAFLDVVMEEDEAGLALVRYIREVLGNRRIRLVLRTGQPGMAPERFVIENYDIDDYRSKTELTAMKLYTAVIGALRAYKELMRVERLVEQRTAEIREINAELQTVNNDLLDSINYARRIQLSILPSDNRIQNVLPSFMVFYEAKDIVSGDFYWFYNQGPYVFFAAVDCTGHGVPGAFMSMLGYSLLNQAVSTATNLEPSAVLERVRQLLIEALSQADYNIGHSADGMDIALCRMDTASNTLQFAGARRPLYICHADCTMDVYAGTRCSISAKEQGSFDQREIPLQPGDTCYIFTDGITDQFGGPDSRKLTAPRLREFLQQLQALPFDTYKGRLKDFFERWKGGEKQTDDILVMALRV